MPPPFLSSSMIVDIFGGLEFPCTVMRCRSDIHKELLMNEKQAFSVFRLWDLRGSSLVVTLKIKTGSIIILWKLFRNAESISLSRNTDQNPHLNQGFWVIYMHINFRNSDINCVIIVIPVIPNDVSNIQRIPNLIQYERY